MTDSNFVKTLEYDEIMADVEKLPKFESVIGLGGGQAVDYAKMVAWKSHMPLYQVPTSIATNAVFGHRAGVRFNSVVRYVGYVEPVAGDGDGLHLTAARDGDLDSVTGLVALPTRRACRPVTAS